MSSYERGLYEVLITEALEARLAGAPLELEVYGWQGEIKSATFHGLDVTKEGEDWRAQVILDV